ncbi:MAG: ATP phosphoribosyltransferase regulatory subunit [Pyrinomonadaceae bacterium]
MSEPLSRIPNGLRYYFGSEARLRRAVEDTVMAVFDGWSYEEITTPSVDYYALFERGMGHEAARRSFRFTDTDGRLLALRPDVTSSVARAASTLFAKRQRPLRLCYAAPVFRQQPTSHAEWRRESTQFGCEHIGSAAGGHADMEVLAIVAEVMQRLGLRRAHRITLSSVEVFNGVAERLELDGASRERMRQLIDAKDATELERFLEPYTTSGEDRRAFARLARLSGKREILHEARRVIKNERSMAAFEALDAMWDVIESLDLSDSFEIDLGDVSSLDYYTGLVFKIYVFGAGARVGRGGRYDNLTSNFGKPEPAIGFVLDLDALTDVLGRASSASTLAGHKREPLVVETRSGEGNRAFLEAAEARARGERVKLESR